RIARDGEQRKVRRGSVERGGTEVLELVRAEPRQPDSIGDVESLCANFAVLKREGVRIDRRPPPAAADPCDVALEPESASATDIQEISAGYRVRQCECLFNGTQEIDRNDKFIKRPHSFLAPGDIGRIWRS